MTKQLVPTQRIKMLPLYSVDSIGTVLTLSPKTRLGKAFNEDCNSFILASTIEATSTTLTLTFSPCNSISYLPFLTVETLVCGLAC